MRLAFVHIVDDNFGDTNCCPRLVLPEWAHCPEYNIADYQRHARRDDVLVIGGGGLLHPKIDAWIKNVSRRRPVFVWGVGINYHDGVVPELKPVLERCVRVTLRHRTNEQFPYCPCPSLGRPEFLEYMATPVIPVNDMVFYSHKARLISRESGIAGVPELLNSRKELNRAGKDDLRSVLRFLGSGRVVVTNSYHGVLWSMALDRPVVVWRPFSTRFVYQNPFPREADAFVKTANELKHTVARLLKGPSLPIGQQGFALLREARETILNEAENVLRTLPRIKLKPEAPPALSRPLGDKAAIAACRNAIELAPKDAKPRFDLGNLLRQQGKHAESVVFYREAIALDPGFVAAHNNIGISLFATGKLDEAIQSYGRAIGLDPAYSHAFNNLGTALVSRNDLTKAMPNFRKAVELDPLSASAHFNLANCCQGAVLLDEAMASYERGIALAPAEARHHWNYAIALLMAGRYDKGWQEYEWRWTGCPDMAANKPGYKPPQWGGEDITGKLILLYCEQGIGDTIQFIRYAPMVAARRARVIVRCQSSLARLLGSVPGIDAVITGKSPLPRFDTHRALLSLPLLFGTTLETIPARVPYLAADKDLAAAWRTRLGRSPSLKVGLVWGGNEKNRSDASRSCPLASFAPLASIPAVRFFSLQKGSYAAQAKSPPAGMNFTDWMDEVKDFADTAALVANLDLVICVDTAVAHLAGALGKPVWLLNRYESEWRWMLGRDDSPWYPTMRIFRQPQRGDWPSVMKDVAKALAKLAGSPHPERLPSVTSTVTDSVQPSSAPADLARTEKLIRQALAKAPTATRHADLAEVLKLQGKLPEAVDAYQKAVRLDPKDSRLRISLGGLLVDCERHMDAVVQFNAAAKFNPGLASAHQNLGNVLSKLGKHVEAIQSLERALGLKPDDPVLHATLGYSHLSLKDYRSAAPHLEKAAAAVPASHNARFSVANAYFGLLDLDRAVTSFDRAVSLAPDIARYHWNYAMALLLKGDYPRGWKEYEWRWGGAVDAQSKPPFAQPEWNGDDIRGKTILLYCEQGLGDAIQFIRYVPLMAARGARVIVRCDKPLVRLLRSMSGIDAIVLGKEKTPHFEVHRPLLSLPLVFGTTLKTIPARVPYLAADKDLAAAWRTRLGRSPSLKVGLVWGGSEKHRADGARSCPLASFAPLASIPAVRFFSLQKGSYAAQAKSPPAGMNFTDWMDEVKDFADTAALVANLDLVICVDTAVAHLAGALGKPVWLLNRYESEWRWMLGRDDSPWYPTMRIFRQPQASDWASVLNNVAKALGELAGKPPKTPASSQRGQPA